MLTPAEYKVLISDIILFYGLEKMNCQGLIFFEVDASFNC